jgi:CRISPR system Cascade subunit CasE
MSRYFSRVRLNASPRQHDWLRDLARHGEAYRDHALIWKLFPGDGLPRDFLFRSLAEEQTYYVVSARPPVAQPELFDIQCKPYRPQLEAGDWLRFDLRANPTLSVRDASGKSHRHDVLMHAKRDASSERPLAEILDEAGREWIARRAESWGLALRDDALQQDGYRQQRLRRKERIIEYSTLDYQGLARVVDPARLQQALFEGVGHAKGFGCGLLLVRRGG